MSAPHLGGALHPESSLRLAGIVRESIVDGPGIRFTVFAQGCPRRCPGCHNPHTWSFEGGFQAEPQQLLAEMRKDPLVTGLTLSGGEPFAQPTAMAELARLAHGAGYHVISYTGYLYEELLELATTQPAVLELLRNIDVLIDGPFVQALKSYELRFRGSSNQRSIDVLASLATGKAVEIRI